MKNMFKLYKSTLKKLSIPTIIMGALLVISTVLYISANRPHGQYYYGYGSFFRGRPIAFAMAPGLPVFMIVGAAILTYMAFSYLNKRSASDFYHALPYTRTQNFVSRFLAVITYQIAVIAVTLLTSWLVLTVSGTPYIAEFFPRLLLAYTAGSLLVSAGVALAMSITGTLVSNALAAGLILFLPRMFLFIYGQSVADLVARRIIIGQAGILLNPAYNLVTGSLLDISGIWQYYGLSETLINVSGIVYTAVLGLIYLGLAWFFMSRRKSELAGYGAKSAPVACTFAALASFPFLLFGVKDFTRFGVGQINQNSIMTLLIITVIALVVYIVLAFVLSNQWKAVIKALPMFAVVAILAISMVFGVNITAERLGTTLPDRDQIESIHVVESNDWDYRYKGVMNYNGLLASQVAFSDDTVLDMFYESLDENNQEWLNQKNGIYDKEYRESARVLCEFELKNGKKLTRSVDIYGKDIEDLKEAMLQNQDYVDAYTALATDADINYYEDEMRDIYEATWEAYKAEYAQLSEKEKLQINLVNRYSGIINYAQRENNFYRRDVVNTMVYGEIGDLAYTQSIAVSDKTPKTAVFYMNAINDKMGEDLVKVIGSAADLEPNKTYDLSYTVFGDGKNNTMGIYYLNIQDSERDMMPEHLTKEQMLEFTRIVENSRLSDISVKEPFLFIRLSVFGEYQDDYEDYMAFIPITPDDMDLLISYYYDNEARIEYN